MKRKSFQHKWSVLFYLLLPIIGGGWVGVLTSCSDDDDASGSSSLAIVSSSVFFPSQGGDGQVVVAGNETVEAHLPVSWCQATVSGQTVMLTAQPNTTIEGRSAILTLRTASGSARLTVQQRGIVYNFPHQRYYIYGDTAISASLPISYDNATTVTTSASWLSASLQAGHVAYEAQPNTTQRVRSAWVRIASGQYRDSLKVLQYDAQTDILGHYTLAGTEADGSTVELPGTLGYTGKTLYFRVPSRSWNIAMQLDSLSPTLYLSSMEYAGRLKTDTASYYVTLITAPLVDRNFQIYLSSSYGMRALLDYDEQMGTTVGRFEDDGSWASTGFTPNGIVFWLSTARPATVATSVGSMGGLVDPYLYRTD